MKGLLKTLRKLKYDVLLIIAVIIDKMKRGSEK